MNYVHSIQSWYQKYERRVSSFSLLGGFIFDTLTLSRVDALRDNLWVAINLVLVAVCIILLNRLESSPKQRKTASKHFWLITALQFAFGTLIGTFVIFYFRSASLIVSWPFILLLVLALIANEGLKKHYDRLSFQVSFFFLSIFLFSIFIVPVLIHQIGPAIFLLSGMVSLILLRFFFYMFNKFSGVDFKKHRQTIRLSVSTIFILINILYFTNLIPPIPLSLKEAGVYHSIGRDASGNYVVEFEDYGWREFFSPYPNLHITPNQMVYVYSAVFSPASFNTGIIHEWQHFDTTTNKWTTEGEVDLNVLGGRDGGYRTYSTREGLTDGRWRVNVLTSSRQVLGRLRFNVVYTNIEPVLSVETK
ncbi:MAG: DUF2914 domain-containing protein [Minisyncoccota bacterium]